MNVLRRGLLAFYSILLVAAAGGLIALAYNQDQKLDITVRHFNVQAFITSSTGEKWAFIVVMAVVIIFGLFCLMVAFMQAEEPPEKRSLRLHQADGGTVEVTAAALESLLRDQLEQLPEITRADPHVRMRGGAVESDIGVVTDPGTSIASVTAAVAETTARTFREMVGVTHIRRPHVRIQHEPAGVPATPAPAPAEARTEPATTPSEDDRVSPPAG